MTAPSTPPLEDLAARYDAFHTARSRSPLVAGLYAKAMGEDYPHGLDNSSSCDWPLLGLMTARLRMRPGQLLVDAACGTGGTGLWLARALNVALLGFDLSPVAVSLASARRTDFVPAQQAEFRVADLVRTGLPDASVHGVVCVDSVGFSGDREAAVRELGRTLAPGGRLLVTVAFNRDTPPPWEHRARAAGLVVEHVDERPHEPAMWTRVYRLWMKHADELRALLGDVQADRMLTEAQRMQSLLPQRRAVLLTLRRPPIASDAPGAADTMDRPDTGGCEDAPSTSGRTPQ